MVQAIGFAVRDSAGGMVRGTVGGEGGNFIPVGAGEKISLNISSASVAGYERQGSDLIVKLNDGSSIVLNGYFAPGAENHLFLSSDGVISEVILNDSGNGLIYAEYGPAEGWNKFSALDDLRFAESAMGAGEYSDEPAGMGFLAPGLLGGMSGVGAAGIGAGVLGGAALLGGGGNSSGEDTTDGGGGDGNDTTGGGDGNDTTGGGDGNDTTGGGDGNDTTGGGDGNDTTGGGDGNDTTGGGDGNDTTGGGDGNDTTGGGDGNDTTGGGDGNDTTGGGDGNDTTGGGDGNDTTGGGGDDRATPTVDRPNSTNTLTTNTDDPRLVVTGTGEPGDRVVVNIGGETKTTTINANGTWGVSFPRGDFPADGTYRASVSVTGGGTSTQLVGPHFIIDMTPPPVEATEGVQSAGHVENAAAYQNGVQIAGEGEVGARIEVTIGDHSHTTTVGANGQWSVTFTQAEVAGGEYSVPVRIVATDALGNQTVLNETLVVDTVTNVAFNAMQAGDNAISGAERNAGVALSGTAQAGATVVVTFEGVEKTVTAGANGTWTVNYATSEIRAGTYTSTATVTATDAAGNTATSTHDIRVDTEVRPFTQTPDLGGDIYLNGAEAAEGLTVTGSVESGSSVMVRFGDSDPFPARILNNGTWRVTIPTSAIPAGESVVTLTAVATDGLGNTSTLTQQINVDTLVRNLALTGEVAGDGILNASEAAAGLVLRGTVEGGAAVKVVLSNGAEMTTTADTQGRWSVTFAANTLPSGEADMTATVSAVDRAGNTAQFVEDFRLDTIAPPAADVLSIERVAAGVREIGTVLTDDIYTFNRIDPTGAVTTVNATRTDDTVWDEANFRFSAAVPDGSYLVINNADAAGNTASTLLIVDNTSAADVDLTRGGLTRFDFAAIDLSFAPDAELTITEAQLVNLTGADNTLIIKGDADDTVTATGAENTGNTTMIGGERYVIYTLGDDGAQLIIDEEVNRII